MPPGLLQQGVACVRMPNKHIPEHRGLECPHAKAHGSLHTWHLLLQFVLEDAHLYLVSRHTLSTATGTRSSRIIIYWPQPHAHILLPSGNGNVCPLILQYPWQRHEVNDIYTVNAGLVWPERGKRAIVAEDSFYMTTNSVSLAFYQGRLKVKLVKEIEIKM